MLGLNIYFGKYTFYFSMKWISRSHMTWRLSPVGVVWIGIELLAINEAPPCYLVNEEPQENPNKHSLPVRFVDLIPHLLVKKMDLLHISNVASATGSICDYPRSEIMHMGHLSPTMFKLGACHQSTIFKSRLFVTSCWCDEIFKSRHPGLHIV